MPALLSNTPVDASIEDVVDHIMYAGQLIGFKHVGIGSDFDGMLHGPQGLENVSKFPAIAMELLKRGVDENAIKQVMGLNIIRVLSENEEQARSEFQAKQVPLRDEIDSIWTGEQLEMIRTASVKNT
ncbi:hypothetical protein CAC42_6853 [Sphaceloma murrayae]|uniref:Dipeptidase n=1 Tax=Sphaceloma murrayae TaxID=2082308 RepID=A0A2K1QHG1_9PEZI|nr:hypothetical protein CAC42_6853 [Sphaceloma murrayae]